MNDIKINDGVGIPSVERVEKEEDEKLKDFCRGVKQRECSSCEVRICHLHPQFKKPGPDDVVI